MSAFYGMIKGNRGCATRGGSKNSGYKATAQSYDGSVITYMWYDDNNELMIEIGTNDHSSCSINDTIFRGKFEDFKNLKRG